MRLASVHLRKCGLVDGELHRPEELEDGCQAVFEEIEEPYGKVLGEGGPRLPHGEEVIDHIELCGGQRAAIHWLRLYGGGVTGIGIPSLSCAFDCCHRGSSCWETWTCNPSPRGSSGRVDR